MNEKLKREFTELNSQRNALKAAAEKIGFKPIIPTLSKPDVPITQSRIDGYKNRLFNWQKEFNKFLNTLNKK